jgi:hypothetical protein
VEQPGKEPMSNKAMYILQYISVNKKKSRCKNLPEECSCGISEKKFGLKRIGKEKERESAPLVGLKLKTLTPRRGGAAARPRRGVYQERQHELDEALQARTKTRASPPRRILPPPVGARRGSCDLVVRQGAEAATVPCSAPSCPLRRRRSDLRCRSGQVAWRFELYF